MNFPAQTDNKSTLHETEKLAWIQLSRTSNIGPVTFFNLLDVYGTAEKALDAVPEIAKRKKSKRKFIIPKLSDIKREYDHVRKEGGDILAACETAFPLPLTSIDDTPPVITALGRTELLEKSCIGIVGARNASLNGCKFAQKIAYELGQNGHTVVSGLARGIDTAAHNGSLESGTIAVVAGGANVVYPQENQNLYEQIKDTGLILAENPWDMPPRNTDFPRRNRIVSGISEGIVVVEAAKRSGSLITARLAAEQGRDVYAVPGFPYDPRAAGPNSLIRDGAILVRDANDILDSMNNFMKTTLFEPPQSPYTLDQPTVNKNKFDKKSAEEAEKIILESLSYTAIGVDELARACQLTISVLQFSLLELEIAGRIERLPGNRVVLKEQ